MVIGWTWLESTELCKVSQSIREIQQVYIENSAWSECFVFIRTNYSDSDSIAFQFLIFMP